MAQCLVTKLKVVVNNPNLPKAGELKWSFSGTWNEGQNFTIKPIEGQAITLEISDGFNFWESTNRAPYQPETKIGKKVIVSSYKRLIVVAEDDVSFSGSFTITLLNKYAISHWRGGVNYDYNKYVKDLAYCSNMENLLNNNIKGNIVDMTKWTKLATLDLAGNHYITGELAELCAGMVANGRRDGTLKISTNTLISVNGVSGTKLSKTVRFGESMESPTSEDTLKGYQIS